MSKPATTIYLLRHGATEANLMKPYILQGRGINKGLAPEGVQQAQAASEFLKRVPLDLCFCSPMLRAQETARIICDPHGITPLVLHELIEGDVGEWEGKSWEWIQAEDAVRSQAYLQQPGIIPYPNGESYEHVVARVKPALQRICQQHAGKRIAVIAHNIVNRSLLADILQIDMNRAKDIKQSNCGINVLNHSGNDFQITTINAAFHLDGLH